MSAPTLVLDTNVVVSALRSSAGASHRLMQLIDQVIDYLCRIGKRCAVHFGVRPGVRDPGDEVLTRAEALRRLGVMR